MKGKILSPEEYKNLCIKYNLKNNTPMTPIPVAPAQLVVPVVPTITAAPSMPPSPGPVTRNRCGRCSRK